MQTMGLKTSKTGKNNTAVVARSLIPKRSPLGVVASFEEYANEEAVATFHASEGHSNVVLSIYRRAGITKPVSTGWESCL